MSGHDDRHRVTRRALLQALSGTLGAAVVEPSRAASSPAAAPAAAESTLELTINGIKHTPVAHPLTTLLEFIRDHAGLTGPKRGCEIGACGACTALLDGKRVRALRKPKARSK